MAEVDRPYIFTKCGLRWNEQDPYARLHQVESRMQWSCTSGCRATLPMKAGGP